MPRKKKPISYKEKSRERLNNAFKRITKELRERAEFPVDVFYVLPLTGSHTGGKAVICKAGHGASNERIETMPNEFIGRYLKDFNPVTLKEDIAYHFGTPDVLLPHERTDYNELQ